MYLKEVKVLVKAHLSGENHIPNDKFTHFFMDTLVSFCNELIKNITISLINTNRTIKNNEC